jgi:hypothetical protein
VGFRNILWDFGRLFKHTRNSRNHQYNDHGGFNMKKIEITPQVKKINLQALTNILKESEIIRSSNYGEMLTHTLVHPNFGDITVVKTSGDHGYLFHN